MECFNWFKIMMSSNILYETGFAYHKFYIQLNTFQGYFKQDMYKNANDQNVHNLNPSVVYKTKILKIFYSNFLLTMSVIFTKNHF